MAVPRRHWLPSMVLVLLLICPGVSGMAYAQSLGQVFQTQGTIVHVDCEGRLLTLGGPSGQEVFLVTQQTTVWTRTERLEFCDLPQFTGAIAIVLFAQIGTQKIAGRINLLVFPVGGVVAAGDVGRGEEGKGHTGGPSPSSEGHAGGSGPSSGRKDYSGHAASSADIARDAEKGLGKW